MNHDAAFVVNEAAFSEAVHEVGNPGACGSDHGGQRVVRDSGKNDRRALLDSYLGQLQQETRQPPFAVVKDLSAQVFLELDVPIR